MPTEETQAVEVLRPSPPTPASHKDLPRDPPVALNDVDVITHSPTNGLDTSDVPISAQAEDGLTESDSTAGSRTVDAAPPSANVLPAADRSKTPPSLKERIVVPEIDRVADTETSSPTTFTTEDSTMSQVSLASMKDVPLDSSPPLAPHPKVPEKDILRRLNTSSPVPLASQAPHDSRRSSATIAHGQHTVSVVHIMTALDAIAASKEGKRGPLKESVQGARQLVLEGNVGDYREIFEPLRLACETRNEKLMISSLDCIQKLISHSFLTDNNAPPDHYVSPPPSPTASTVNQATSLADLVTLTITSAYTETTPDAVSLQIVKALLSLVLSTTLIIHHSALLKAVRTVYNVFLLSQDSTNQMVAQGVLSQMVNHVFMRCQTPGPSIAPPTTSSGRRASAHITNGSVAVPIDQVSSPPGSPLSPEPQVLATEADNAIAQVSAEPAEEQLAGPMVYVALYECLSDAANPSIQ
jgi:brefeldin A-inhibited guanine nucleotide-exchange protein